VDVLPRRCMTDPGVDSLAPFFLTFTLVAISKG
jgi:hypothetical protein